MSEHEPVVCFGGTTMEFDSTLNKLRGDEGVSPVIAVILMVAITVVLAATVYVWVSGFATDDTGPEQASATAEGLDTDDNGDVDMIRVTLTSGENAPYTLECGSNDCSANGFASDSEFIVSGTNAAGTAISPSGLYEDSGKNTAWADGDTWAVGQNIYIECGSADTADLSVSVGQSGDKTAILDTTVQCDE